MKWSEMVSWHLEKIPAGGGSRQLAKVREWRLKQISALTHGKSAADWISKDRDMVMNFDLILSEGQLPNFLIKTENEEFKNLARKLIGSYRFYLHPLLLQSSILPHKCFFVSGDTGGVLAIMEGLPHTGIEAVNWESLQFSRELDDNSLNDCIKDVKKLDKDLKFLTKMVQLTEKTWRGF